MYTVMMKTFIFNNCDTYYGYNKSKFKRLVYEYLMYYKNYNIKSISSILYKINYGFKNFMNEII